MNENELKNRFWALEVLNENLRESPKTIYKEYDKLLATSISSIKNHEK